MSAAIWAVANASYRTYTPAAIQSSKYALRLSDSASKLSKAKPFTLPDEADRLRKWSKMLIKIRKGSGKYGAMEEGPRDKEAVERTKSYKFNSIADLKGAVISVGAHINKEVRN